PTVWAAQGHRRVAPVHLYRFDAAAPLFRVIGLGAIHGTELPYLFGTFGHTDRDPTFVLGGRRTARRVGERMRRRWAAFVRGEAPDAGPDAPHWPRYDEAEQSLLLNTRDTVVTDLDGP